MRPTIKLASFLDDHFSEGYFLSGVVDYQQGVQIEGDEDSFRQ
jgi:hypothetical protein